MRAHNGRLRGQTYGSLPSIFPTGAVIIGSNPVPFIGVRRKRLKKGML